MPVVLGLYPWFCASAQADGLQFVEETSTHFPQPNPTEYTNQLTIGDIDGDGDFDLDVKTASTGSNNSRLDRNDGISVFSLVTDIPSDSTCYAYDFGDINGDGDLDLLGINANTVRPTSMVSAPSASPTVSCCWPTGG